MDHAQLRELKALFNKVNKDLKKFAHLQNTKAYESMYATANDLAQAITELELKVKHA